MSISFFVCSTSEAKVPHRLPRSSSKAIPPGSNRSGMCFKLLFMCRNLRPPASLSSHPTWTEIMNPFLLLLHIAVALVLLQGCFAARIKQTRVIDYKCVAGEVGKTVAALNGQVPGMPPLVIQLATFPKCPKYVLAHNWTMQCPKFSSKARRLRAISATGSASESSTISPR